MPKPTEQFVILSIICDKVTEEWGEIFEELKKEGGSFWNNILSLNVGFVASELDSANANK